MDSVRWAAGAPFVYAVTKEPPIRGMGRGFCVVVTAWVCPRGQPLSRKVDVATALLNDRRTIMLAFLLPGVHWCGSY